MAPELVPSSVTQGSFMKPATLPSRAYVTFLAGNGDYVKGVVGLAKGLRKVKSGYSLVVAVLPDVPEEHRNILESQGCIVREIEPVYPPENHAQFAMAYYIINYSKLRIWEGERQIEDGHNRSRNFEIRTQQTEKTAATISSHTRNQKSEIRNRNSEIGIQKSANQQICKFANQQSKYGSFIINQQFAEYEKMVYLDSDIQVYDNIDHLFDLPDGYFYAALDCFCEFTWGHTPQYKVGYCQLSPEKKNWPAEMGSPPAPYFNAGMFVFEPSLSTSRDLLNTLKVTPSTPFAEQDFLNMYFNKIYKPIPNDYNLILSLLWRHPDKVDLEKTKAVHYCAPGSKPWRYTGKEESMQREDVKIMVKKWWDIYNDKSLDYKKPLGGVLEDGNEKVSMQPFIEALSEAGPVQYVTAPSAA